MKPILQLLKLTLTEKKRLLISFLSSILVSFFTYIFVNLIQPIIDVMFLSNPGASQGKGNLADFFFRTAKVRQEDLVWMIPLLLVVVVFGKGFFTFLSSFTMRSIGLRIVKGVRDGLFNKLTRQSASYFDRVSTGELLSRVTNDVDKLQEAVSGSMGDFIQEAFTLVALLIFIFMSDWHLALTALVVTPLAMFPLVVFSKHLRKKGRLNQMRMASIFRLLHESITGNKIVKAFSMEKFEVRKFFNATKAYLKTSLKLAWIGSLSSPFMEFVGGVMAAFILFIGAGRISRGLISPGDFSSFLMAIFWMYMPIRRLSRANNVIQNGVACYERIQEIMQSKPDIADSPKAFHLPKIEGNVNFERVSFCYDQRRKVLDKINFEVEARQTVALVGLSGAGKTTIINLILRFYDPTEGRIKIDGYDIRNVTLSSLRSQIGLVTQELILFDDSVRNNIAYGMDDMPLDKIRDAAGAAKADEFIEEMADGYDAQIGEKGSRLSTGQKQRLAIARALLKDPPILILDEATSALDSKSEKLIQIALDNVMKNRTTFVIAHRLSTIRNADKILVVDKGRIAEAGSHAELLKKNGIYRRLHDLQFPESKENGP
jgi:subfamily B ATP-binding cassette protein MsbA